MRDVLPSVVSNCQKAFQENKYITDATRLVQDIIDYCDREGEDGMILFCDQDNAYPRVEWDFMLGVRLKAAAAAAAQQQQQQP